MDCSGPQKTHIFLHKYSFFKPKILISNDFLYECSSKCIWEISYMTQCRLKYVFLWHLIWDMSHQYIYTQYVSHFHYSPKLSYEISWHVLWGWLLPIWHFVALSNFCGNFMSIRGFIYEIFETQNVIWEITRGFMIFFGSPYERKMTGIGGHFLHMWRNLVRRSGQRCIWYALSYFQPQNLIFDPQNLIFVVTKSHFLAQKWGAHCSIPLCWLL